MTEYSVTSEALRAESPKWDSFHDAITPVQRAVADAGLGVTAFFCGSPVALGLFDLNAMVHQSAYEGYRTFMHDVLNGALEEFPQIADALIKNAEVYDKNEEVAGDRLNKVWDASQW